MTLRKCKTTLEKHLFKTTYMIYQRAMYVQTIIWMEYFKALKLICTYNLCKLRALHTMQVPLTRYMYERQAMSSVEFKTRNFVPLRAIFCDKIALTWEQERWNAWLEVARMK